MIMNFLILAPSPEISGFGLRSDTGAARVVSLCLFGTFRLFLSPSAAAFLVNRCGRVLSCFPVSLLCHGIHTISHLYGPANFTAFLLETQLCQSAQNRRTNFC